MKFVIFLLLALPAFAQHSEQPVKEDTTDYRAEVVVFSIEEVGKEKRWSLEKNATNTSVLKKKEKDDVAVTKIDGRIAQRLDRDFASRFLKCQYEIANVEGDCKVTLRLTMKGETQDICAKDDKKNQEIQSFVQELSKRFQ
ncbi:MAG: hypothetical protein ACJ76H_00915 [Bacteriovoracaceae bacterium]